MPRLIRDFAGRACHFVGFVVRLHNFLSGHLHYRIAKLNKPQHEKTYLLPNETSDQLAHARCLISLRCPYDKTLNPWLSKMRQRRFWWNCANAMAVLNLSLAHMSESIFSDVAAQIIYRTHTAVPFPNKDYLNLHNGKARLLTFNTRGSTVKWLSIPWQDDISYYKHAWCLCKSVYLNICWTRQKKSFFCQYNKIFRHFSTFKENIWTFALQYGKIKLVTVSTHVSVLKVSTWAFAW